MIDRYTKVVLTVIAMCLGWLSVKDFGVVRPALAQGGQPVTIVGIALPEDYFPGPRFGEPRRVLPVWQKQ